ncbi:hypothetical protein L202_01531 [Cryptococcus amylolentus CBS 6039]|uniref:Potassium channel domain-containing protein n=2 Tax=Cryptococcus amylolentus TaxID=104669 RepID=A0A1E3I4E7_9TREE|nr:hypothetical protein L202_01531 [Cryptococcus amylolentus CBS 6039]ODN83387.1 hypothetical protein L202_01531 [Cryptococcus amylolentus CBS 6039]ODO10916.1 hypothetical protein I350_01515 [Cryptococcus amylolentus CBS 6273]
MSGQPNHAAPPAPDDKKQVQQQFSARPAQGDDVPAESNNDRDVGHVSTWPRYALKLKRWRSFAKYSPLISATLAPMSTLMDIPALGQRWYSNYGITQSDPPASLVLSAVGLALNVIANILLVIRFSSKKPFWVKHATTWSLYFWLAKTIVAAVNLILFGITTRNSQGYKYLEGFWCAVVSIVISGIICVTLLLHYFLAFGHAKSDTSDIRNEGKRFMLSVTAFVGILAAQSLVFSKIEGWSYLDGIYMSVQTALTIGYGDLVPSTTAGKVLVFPFSVLTISQLGNEIALIIGFLSDRAELRREKWRQQYEGAMHREANSKRPKAGLTEEMALVYRINAREEMMNQMYDLMWSAFSLIVFWVLGALAFSQIEGWTYGNAIYMCMILSLTIGFGDFTPVQPGGRVTFVVYALMAVPIVTSFAVQTITVQLSTFSQRGVSRRNFVSEQERAPEAFAPHADFVAKYHQSYSDLREKILGGGGDGEDGESKSARHDGEVGSGRARVSDDAGASNTLADEDGGGEADDEVDDDLQRLAKDGLEVKTRAMSATSKNNSVQSNGDGNGRANVGAQVAQTSSGDDIVMTRAERELEVDLLKQLLTRVVRFEVGARQMLLDSMDKSVERTLLLADRNVQIRDVRSLRGDDANIISLWAGAEHAEEAKHPHTSKRAHDSDPDKTHDNPDPPDMLARVSDYRSTFAEILVLGGILQKLEGGEMKKFERWRGGGSEDEDEEISEEIREGSDGRIDGEAEDMDKVAEKQWGGLTGGALRRHMKEDKSRSRTYGKETV